MNENQNTVSGDELSTMLGVGKRRLRQLADEGVIFKAKRGDYQLVSSVAGYIAFIKSIGGSHDPETIAHSEQKKKYDALSAEEDYRRKKRENDKEANLLIPEERVKPRWIRLLKMIRANIEEYHQTIVDSVPELTAKRIRSLERARDDLFIEIAESGIKLQPKKK